MTRVATNDSAALMPVPVRTVMWQTYDDGGWAALAENDFEKATRYFSKAEEYTSHLTDDDYRHGRTKAGLAWGAYRLEQQFAVGKKSVDPQARFADIAEEAAAAVKMLGEAELSHADKKYQAMAHHLVGVLAVEMCDGSTAERSLDAAGHLYQQLQMFDDYFDALHLRAKLRQCRREFRVAAEHFREIYLQATDPERRFAALIDLANTLVWMGLVREARQLRVPWRRLLVELEQLPLEVPKSCPKNDSAKIRPVDEIFRGRLVFARIHLLYGDFDDATRLLDDAYQRLCSCGEISAICRAVYWIVSAELAVHRGELGRVEQFLRDFKRIVPECKLSVKGYGCLEIVAIDAACQICVVETCCREVIRRRCCRVRRCGASGSSRKS